MNWQGFDVPTTKFWAMKSYILLLIIQNILCLNFIYSIYLEKSFKIGANNFCVSNNGQVLHIFKIAKSW